MVRVDVITDDARIAQVSPDWDGFEAWTPTKSRTSLIGVGLRHARSTGHPA
jgi:hypothetical protein